jgi:TetR/AcrR family transcriptional regulator, repressor for uid operon
MDDGVGTRSESHGPANDIAVEDQFLAASREVFSELGFESATLAKIVDRAGPCPSRRTHHQLTKRALYDEVVSTAHHRVFCAAIAAAETERSLPHRLASFIREIIASDRSHGGATAVFGIAILDSYRNPELQHDICTPKEDVRAYLSAVLDDAVIRGELAADADVDPIVEAILAIVLGLSLHAGFIGDEDDHCALVAMLPGLISGILPPAAA